MSDNLENFYKFADENMFRHTAQEEFAWNVWCTAIESVAIELPSCFIDKRGSEVAFLADLEQALDEAGIKYK